MAVWPEEYPVPSYPLIVTPVWNTGIIELGGGLEQRRNNLIFPKFDVTVNYEDLEGPEVQVLYNFYMARKGAYESFYIFDLALLAGVAFNHTQMYCGTADGSLLIYDIPGRSTENHYVFVNGIAWPENDFSILTGGGDGGSDRIQFNSSPNPGDIITISFRGYQRLRVRFEEDKLPRELFIHNLFKYQSINLRGLSGI